MPRPTLTPGDRARNVKRAVDALPALVAHAVLMTGQHGPADPLTLAAWDAVEVQGAIVHRQARLLAGKSKGG
jgi:hypothetical protein